MKNPKYHIVVVSNNSWCANGDPIIERDCGHQHRTISGAVKCKDKLYNYNPRTRLHSADWHRAEIRPINNTPLTIEERVVIDNLYNQSGGI